MTTFKASTWFVFLYFALGMAPWIALLAANYLVDPTTTWLCLIPESLFWIGNIGWGCLSLALIHRFFVRNLQVEF